MLARCRHINYFPFSIFGKSFLSTASSLLDSVPFYICDSWGAVGTVSPVIETCCASSTTNCESKELASLVCLTFLSSLFAVLSFCIELSESLGPWVFRWLGIRCGKPFLRDLLNKISVGWAQGARLLWTFATRPPCTFPSFPATGGVEPPLFPESLDHQILLTQCPSRRLHRGHCSCFLQPRPSKSSSCSPKGGWVFDGFVSNLLLCTWYECPQEGRQKVGVSPTRNIINCHYFHTVKGCQLSVLWTPTKPRTQVDPCTSPRPQTATPTSHFLTPSHPPAINMGVGEKKIPLMKEKLCEAARTYCKKASYEKGWGPFRCSMDVAV